MTKELLLSLCTRERPKAAAAFIKQWRKTTSGRSQLVVAMEIDDKTMNEYHLPEDAIHLTGMFGSQGAAINAVLETFHDYQYYAFLSDDHRLNTPGWEDMVIDKIKDGGVAYGDDGFQGVNLPTSAFWHGDTLRAVGYVAPPGMTHMYIDNVWKDLGEGIGRLYYMPEVNVEHLHPDAGKAKKDERYHAVNNPTVYSRDFEVYKKWLVDEYPNAVNRMKDAIGL